MKLSEIKGEEALDVLADIIEPVSMMLADPKVKEMWESGKPKLLLVQYLLKNHKKELLTTMAIIDRENPDTYKPSLVDIPKKLLEILNDEDVQSLFT